MDFCGTAALVHPQMGKHADVMSHGSGCESEPAALQPVLESCAAGHTGDGVPGSSQHNCAILCAWARCIKL